MMRSDEHNRHVHGSYAEENAPLLDVDVTDEEELSKSSCTKLYRRISLWTQVNQNATLSTKLYRKRIHQTYQLMLLRNWKMMIIKNLKWLKKEQVISTYSSVVEIYWMNLTLRINGRSCHHQYKRDSINHIHHEKDTMIKLLRYLSKRKSEVT